MATRPLRRLYLALFACLALLLVIGQASTYGNSAMVELVVIEKATGKPVACRIHLKDPDRRSVRPAARAAASGAIGRAQHYYEAVVARPDLPTTQAALGCALGRQGKASDAVPHLRRAVQNSPFDLNAALGVQEAQEAVLKLPPGAPEQAEAGLAG